MQILATAVASAADWEAGFAEPPMEARPQTLWFWMNGNVTAEGIDLDLEAMEAVGLGGAMMFDGATVLPEGPARYLEPHWLELLGHAFDKAADLGLEVGMHNAPGWSSSGGPWITPELSMKQLVWSEATVSGPGEANIRLPRPQANAGYYRDAFVLAFPSLPGEELPYVETVAAATAGAGVSVSPADLCDGNLDTGIPVGPDNPLLLEFAEPTVLQAITVNGPHNGPIPSLRLEVSDDGEDFREIGAVRDPGHHGLRAPACASFEPVRARFVRAIPRNEGTVSEFVLHRTARIRDWVYKANFAYRLGNQIPNPDNAAPVAAIDPASVVDLTPLCRPDGTLDWGVPDGSWTILRLGYTGTGKLNVSASRTGTGLECDKLSREATRFHFETVIGKVLAQAGEQAGKAFRMVEVDSYEAGMQNWTPGFPAEFLNRAGYDITGYLPALVGRPVGSMGVSERFLYDFRRVQADLMREYYFGQLQEMCTAAGLDLYIEGYGQGMFDELQVSGTPDFPMTEFWTRTPWTPNRTVKLVSSAGHVYGKPVIAAESFTGEETTSRWLEYPFALKALGDTMFSFGLNKMIFHRFAHQPHPTAVPGMAMGPWGIHYDRTNTWFPYSGPWLSYLSRCQFLLQQGHYVADVLYFIGERPPDVAQYAMPILPAGYNYDLVNQEVLLNRVRVDKGELVLPEGGRYRFLALPPNMEGITPRLMSRLQELVEAGATILGPQPVFSLTLRGYPESEARLLADSRELWNIGSGLPGDIIPEGTPGELLDRLGVAPDFQFRGKAPDAALSWIHRREGDAHLYFVGNRQRRPDEVVCTFRVSGLQPEIWHPESGEIRKAAIFHCSNGLTEVPLHLGPSESVFVVFREPLNPDAVAQELRIDGKPAVSTGLKTEGGPIAQTDTFSMSLWARPDIDLRVFPEESNSGRIDETSIFYAIPAGEGDYYFGSGHSMAGLAVGRNGAFVVERSSDASPAVLAARFPVSGWNHFCVVYESGRPSLFVNGQLVREGLVSGKKVHPGVGCPPPPVDAVYHFDALDNLVHNSGLPSPHSNGRAFYFEGNLTQPLVHDRALSEEEIIALYRQGLPDPEGPPAVETWLGDGGSVDALAWESGSYALSDGAARPVSVARPLRLTGPWELSFQEGRGAPDRVELAELQSLHLHPEEGVRYFSGTVTYARELELPDAFFADDRRIYLDLGRVEVLARVNINGQPAGTVWKAPFRLDITSLVHPGANSLRIEVTNLWANRLIGDAQLPPENEFGFEGSKGIMEIPEWYRTGSPKPDGGRITFTTWDFYGPGDPLLPSGLLGPVRIYNPVLVSLE